MQEGQRIPVGNTSSPMHSPMNERERMTPPPQAPVAPPGSAGKFSFASRKPEPTRSQSSQAKDASTTRLLDGVISVSLAALFFGLPVFFTGMTLQGLAFEKGIYFYFWLLIAIVSWVAKGVIAGEMKIRKTPLDIPIAIFVAVYILSAAFSVDRWHSFWGAFGDPSRGVLNVVALVIAYYLILSHFTVKRMRIMLSALIAASFVVMIWTLLVVFGVHFLPSSVEQYAPFSLLGSVTSLMIFLGGMLPVFIAAISMVQSMPDRSVSFKTSFTGVLGVGILLDLMILFLLFGGVPWVAVIAGFSFFLLYILAQVVRIEERWTWLPMLVLVVLLAIYMIEPKYMLKTTLPSEATPSMSLSWTIVKESIKDKLVLGSGPATYGYDFSLHRPQVYNNQPLSSLRFSQGTGLYLESIPTIGLLGVIALTVVLLSFVSIGLFLLAQKKENDKFLSLGLWSMAMVILIAALSIQFSGSILIIGALVATLALAVLMKESQSEESYLNLSLQSSPKFALALAFVFLVVSAGVAFTFSFIGRAFLADVSAAKAMESSVGNVDGVAKMRSATESMPKESRYVSYLSQIYLTMATQEFNKPEKNNDLVRQYIQNANMAASLAQSMSPNDIAVQEVLAQAYENTLRVSKPDSVLYAKVWDAYEKASALEPHNPLYYVKLGQVKRSMANDTKDEAERKALIDEAVGLFQKSIDEKKDFTLGYFNLGLAQEASSNVDDAIKTLAQGIVINKTNRDVDELKFNLARLLRIRGKETDLKYSEALLKEILDANDKSLNAYLTLGLVYEQSNQKDEAIKAYEKAAALLSGSNTDEAKKQIQTFIDNVKAGKSNNVAAPVETPQSPSSIAPESALPPIPAAPANPTIPEAQNPGANTPPITPDVQNQAPSDTVTP